MKVEAGKGREKRPGKSSDSEIGLLGEKKVEISLESKKGELGVERRKVSSVMIINQSIFIPLSPRPSSNCTPKPLMFT